MKRPAIIMVCLLLQACSATTEGLGHSLWDSVFGTPGVQMTDDEIQNMPYASQYMQLNGGPQLFVVLAFAEDGQQKWVTQDQATLVTQHGRLVKTLLGGDNLIEVNNLAADPLQHQQAQHAAVFTGSAGYVDAVVRIQHLAGNGVFTAGQIRDAGSADFDRLVAARCARHACYCARNRGERADAPLKDCRRL